MPETIKESLQREIAKTKAELTERYHSIPEGSAVAIECSPQLIKAIIERLSFFESKLSALYEEGYIAGKKYQKEVLRIKLGLEE